ncbi:hypothetical protein [Mycobacterium sp. M23085]|uniref:hypothetical protein n=1 Tax=Mycobacterium sp. M23085 TaxID=3378087 RepID=UPI003877CC23
MPGIANVGFDVGFLGTCSAAHDRSKGSAAAAAEMALGIDKAEWFMSRRRSDAAVRRPVNFLRHNTLSPPW